MLEVHSQWTMSTLNFFSTYQTLELLIGAHIRRIITLQKDEQDIARVMIQKEKEVSLR